MSAKLSLPKRTIPQTTLIFVGLRVCERGGEDGGLERDQTLRVRPDFDVNNTLAEATGPGEMQEPRKSWPQPGAAFHSVRTRRDRIHGSHRICMLGEATRGGWVDLLKEETLVAWAYPSGTTVLYLVLDPWSKVLSSKET